MDQHLEDFDISDVMDMDKFAADFSPEETAHPSCSNSEPSSQTGYSTPALYTPSAPADSIDPIRQSQGCDYQFDMFNASAFDQFLPNIDPSEPAPCAETTGTAFSTQATSSMGSENGRILDLHPRLENVSYPPFNSLEPSVQIEYDVDNIHATQAVDATGNPTPHFFHSDLALDVALSEVASTRPGLPSILNATDRAPLAETEMATISSGPIALDGTDSSVLSNPTLHQGSFNLPSDEIAATMSKPRKQLQLAGKSSLSDRQYVPIRPKQPVLFQNSDLPSTGKLEDASNSSLLLSEVTLASRTPGPIAKAKRKRSQSLGLRGTAVPGALYSCFRVKDHQQQMAAPKRQKIKKACLRCQLMKAKVFCLY